MLTIRLSRIGKKNKPMYRLIISEKSRDPYGRALEILGSYNPYTKDLQAKRERIKYWLGQGAGISNTVNNLLIKKGIIKGEKVKASKSRRKKKGGDDSAASASSGQASSGQASSGQKAEQAEQDNKPQEAEKTEMKPAEKTEDEKAKQESGAK